MSGKSRDRSGGSGQKVGTGLIGKSRDRSDGSGQKVGTGLIGKSRDRSGRKNAGTDPVGKS